MERYYKWFAVVTGKVLLLFCRTWLCSLLHTSHRYGWHLFLREKVFGLRHCYVWQRHWHVCASPCGAATD